MNDSPTLDDLVVNTTLTGATIVFYSIDDSTNPSNILSNNTPLVEGTTYYAFQGTGDCAQSLAITVHADCSYITVTKEANVTEVTNVGDEIIYTISITNNNIISVNPTSVNDPLVNVSYVSGDDNDNGLIDFGETWIYQGTYIVAISDFDNNGIDFNGNADGDGDIDNQVTVSSVSNNGTTVSDVSADAVVLLIQNPAISLTKAGSGNFCPTDTDIIYTITVTNTGNVALTGVTVTDANADSIVPSVIGSIQVGESVTVVATHIITNDDIINGAVYNSAQVQATTTNGYVVTDISDDPNNMNDIDSDGDGDPDDITVVYEDFDCDGILDDIDDDNDGIIDIVENNGFDPNIDQDGDNVPQYLDDDDNDSAIGNDDGLPQNDTDGDNLPNHLDIDADGDGIPDNVEGQSTLDYIPPTGIDTDGDGLDDAYDDVDSLGIIPQDTDLDATPDYLDTDSDNDNVPDNIEGNDQNHDGIADATATGTDTDYDGLDDGFEGSDVDDVDVNDEINIPFIDLPDTDIDVNDGGDVDYRDTDDDNDDIPTTDEDADSDGNYANDDCDEDGIPDYLDPDLCIIEMPEGFSPDGDGENDNFFVEGLANLYPNFMLEIYDRYGNIVYHYQHNGTANEPEWWNGISNGRLTISKSSGVPVGTYFYILYPNKKGKRAKVGWLYVNK